jgi:hypothetical protein
MRWRDPALLGDTLLQMVMGRPLPLAATPEEVSRQLLQLVVVVDRDEGVDFSSNFNLPEYVSSPPEYSPEPYRESYTEPHIPSLLPLSSSLPNPINPVKIPAPLYTTQPTPSTAMGFPDEISSTLMTHSDFTSSRARADIKYH